MKELFKPEICYAFNPLNMEDIQNAYKNQTIITGYVEEIYPKKRYLSVRLHQDLFAILPYSEVSIYENEHVDSEEYKMAFILKGKTIRIKVTKIDGINIFVSRKQSMLEALAHLKTCDCVVSYVYYVTKHCAYADIGHGIIGHLPISEICVTRINSITEYIQHGTILKLKLLDFDEKLTATVSYRRTFSQKYVRISSLVDCDVKLPVDDLPSGYFVAITPTLVGIVDKTETCPAMKYGDRVQCLVVGKNDFGLKLRFVKKLYTKRCKN